MLCDGGVDGARIRVEFDEEDVERVGSGGGEEGWAALEVVSG